MDIINLKLSASQLISVSEKTAKEYSDKAEILITRINTELLKCANLEELIGKDNIDTMRDNHANHVSFIASIFKNYNPEVFVRTVVWVFRAYRSHGFISLYWTNQFNSWIKILQEELTSQSSQEIVPYYEWLQANIPIFEKLSEEI